VVLQVGKSRLTLLEVKKTVKRKPLSPAKPFIINKGTASFKNWSRLNLGFLDGEFFGDGFEMACSFLGEIGDEETVELLEAFTQDAEKAKF
jgi:hypothetical protein